MNAQVRFDIDDEIMLDYFAGGGGASLGMEQGVGKPVALAVNHNPVAMAIHKMNHPHTEHFIEDVWAVDIVAAVRGRRVGLAWFSPDCTHHSKARGSKPVQKGIRALAWVVPKVLHHTKARIFILENVEEFEDWGPLIQDANGDEYPDPHKLGFTFRRWWAELERLGYRMELRQIAMCDIGGHTIRNRLFIVGRNDGLPIVWPEQTHGNGAIPYNTAADIIDWSLPCHSIFLTPEEARRYNVRRPLKDNTMKRIAAGVWKHTINAAEPFVVPLTHHGEPRIYGLDEPLRTVTCANRGELALVSPSLAVNTSGHGPAGMGQPIHTITTGHHHMLVEAFLATYYGDKRPADHRTNSMDVPLRTQTTENRHALVTSQLIKLKGTSRAGMPVTVPVPTIQAQGLHIAEVRAFLMKYYSRGGNTTDPREPLHTVTSKDRIGLVTVHGYDYQIVDIGMRMLSPRELFRGQDFPDSYKIDGQWWDEKKNKWRKITKTQQVEACGNSVDPLAAEKLAGLNWNVRAGEIEVRA